MRGGGVVEVEESAVGGKVAPRGCGGGGKGGERGGEVLVLVVVKVRWW